MFRHRIIWLLVLTLVVISECMAQSARQNPPSSGFLARTVVYKGDTIPDMRLADFYVFAPLHFKNKRQQQAYDRLVVNVKKVLPIANEVHQIVIETYEVLQTLPDEKSKSRHIKAVEKSLKQQYMPRMKKLTLSQGKLLIKLVDRQCNQSSYQLAKAFIGPFRAGLYQAFAGLFGASLRKEYDPEGDDKMVERVVLLVQSGQL